MKHAFADTLVVIAELTVRSDRVEAFLDYVVENLSISRSYPGNIAFDILIDETRPGHVTFHEIWASAASQQAYMAWRTQAGDLAQLMSYLAGEPTFTALRSIAPPPPADG